MFSTRKKILVPAAIVMSLALAPVLTACGGNPIQGIVQNVTGGKVDIGGTQVPKDFPKEIPLASGEVIFGGGLGNEEGKVWNVTVKVSGSSAMDSIKSQLESAGFESISSGGSSLEATTGMFSKDPYGVLVIVSKDDDSGAYVANYTVTFSKEDS